MTTVHVALIVIGVIVVAGWFSGGTRVAKPTPREEGTPLQAQGMSSGGGTPQDPSATAMAFGYLVILGLAIAFIYGMVQLGMSSYDEPSTDRPPVHYAPSTDLDREIQQEVECLEAAYDRYEGNPAAYPGYTNELDYANALCDR